MPRLYGGLRLTRRGLRPYIGVRLFSIGGGKRKPREVHHKQTVIFTCSACGAVTRLDAKFCGRCGQPFSGRIIAP